MIDPGRAGVAEEDSEIVDKSLGLPHRSDSIPGATVLAFENPKRPGMHWRFRIISHNCKNVRPQGRGDWQDNVLARLARNQPDLIFLQVDV